MVVRENTEGLYVGAGGFLKYGTPDEVAVQESINTRKGVDRCLKFAFELTRKRNQKPRSSPWWPRPTSSPSLRTCGSGPFQAMAPQYPDITTDYAHVDATCMWLVKNPEWFDVVVTDNLFGDIITDLGAMIQGGMGVAAGGNINPEGVSMFEPIGGSAPKYTGLERGQPPGRHRRGPDDAGATGGDQGGPAAVEAAHQKDRRQRHAEHGRGQDGPIHQPGGRHGGPIRAGGDIISSQRSAVSDRERSFARLTANC